MPVHDLKIWSKYFTEIRSGLKNTQLLRDIDRRLNAGDIVNLIEIKPCNCCAEESMPCAQYNETGNVITCSITSVVIINEVFHELNNMPGNPAFVILSFEIISEVHE